MTPADNLARLEHALAAHRAAWADASAAIRFLATVAVMDGATERAIGMVDAMRAVREAVEAIEERHGIRS